MDYNRPQIVKILQLTQDELDDLRSAIDTNIADWKDSKTNCDTPSWRTTCDRWIEKLTELSKRLK